MNLNISLNISPTDLWTSIFRWIFRDKINVKLTKYSPQPIKESSRCLHFHVKCQNIQGSQYFCALHTNITANKSRHKSTRRLSGKWRIKILSNALTKLSHGVCKDENYICCTKRHQISSAILNVVTKSKKRLLHWESLVVRETWKKRFPTW